MSRLTAISAGLRTPSSTRLLTDRLTAAVRDALSERGVDVEVRVVEVREHAHAITDALLTGFATGELREVLEDVVASDALVVVTPTFQASYAGLFKSFMDLVEEGSLRGMPVVLGATGGTERHSLVIEHAMRPLFAHLRAMPVATGVYAATSDFGGPGSAALDARISRAAEELADLAAGAPTRRGQSDGFTEVTPFAELLARGGIDG